MATSNGLEFPAHIGDDAREFGVSHLERQAFHTLIGQASIAAAVIAKRHQQQPKPRDMLNEAIYPIPQQHYTPGR